MISSKKYAKKIVELAYYNFPLVHPKETVIKVTNALIDEYTNQLVQQKQTEINELVEFIENHKSQLFMSYQNEAELLIQKHTKK